jgi:hypothetical protein
VICYAMFVTVSYDWSSVYSHNQMKFLLLMLSSTFPENITIILQEPGCDVNSVSKWKPNAMTWGRNKQHIPATILSEYGVLPAVIDILYTFHPILRHRTSRNLQDPAGSTQWYNFKCLGHSWIQCKHPHVNIFGADMATTSGMSRR